ncbi:MAG: hypothetical protein JW982_15650, partial [Spirochaetes bacterium]|nr:hypothetical protein [Spirochaetota bacterium]
MFLKNFKIRTAAVLFLFLFIMSISVFPADQAKEKEVWCYLMEHEIKRFSGNEPITDLFLFSARVDYKGNLYGLSKKPALPKQAKNMRVHLVVTLFGNSTLMDLIFTPDSGYQKKLISDIVKFSKDYDGVQIDFESIPKEMGSNYTKFLKKLKSNLDSKKIFSVALQAKKSSVKNAFDYASIGKIADKVLVMAYDQHWATSDAGPVAELAWCEDIVDYTIKEIDPDKVIMGIPLYGRAWENVNHTRAVRYPSVTDWMNR